MKRYIALILSATLPLVMFSAFMPVPTNQLDIWLLWSVSMLLVALPMMYAEIALAYRSGTTPLLGMQKLTREADTSTVWRGFSWLSILMAISVSAWLVANATSGISPLLVDMGIDLPVYGLAVGLMVIAVILSLLGFSTAMVALALMVAGSVLGVLNGLSSFSLQMTVVTFSEWGRVVMMALISMGVGSGLYWFTTHETSTHMSTHPASLNQGDDGVNKANSNKNKQVASKVVLPIWLTQMVMGCVALFVNSVSIRSMTVEGLGSTATVNSFSIAHLLISLGGLLLATLLLYFASQLLMSRLGMIKGMAITLVIACVMVLIPTSILLMLLVVLTLMSGMMLSVFTGWKMKISHLRKSLNFSNEAIYNLWRVAIRLLVPLCLLMAMVGWIQSWIT